MCPVGWCIQGELASERKKKKGSFQKKKKKTESCMLCHRLTLMWYLNARRTNEKEGMNEMWQGLLSHVLWKNQSVSALVRNEFKMVISLV